jgi:hypothetical protein
VTRAARSVSRVTLSRACARRLPASRAELIRRATPSLVFEDSGPLGHRHAMSSRMMTPRPPIVHGASASSVRWDSRVKRGGGRAARARTGGPIRVLGLSMALTRHGNAGHGGPSARLDDNPPSRSRRRSALRDQRQVRLPGARRSAPCPQPFCGAPGRYGACNAWTRPRLRLAPPIGGLRTDACDRDGLSLV